MKMQYHYVIKKLKTIPIIVIISMNLLSTESLIAQQSVAAVDSLALVSLYQNTNGDSWNNNTGWLTAPIVEWYGVDSIDEVQSGEFRITRIDLSENNLKGVIPSDIGNLTYLNRLDLEENGLSGILPEQIGELRNLQRLNISHNRDLSPAPIPDWIRNLTNLERLEMVNTYRIGVIPDFIDELPNLEELTLYGNHLVRTPDEPIALFLTWQQDPTSTMTIDWHVLPDTDHENSPVVHYRHVDSDDWQQIEASQHEFPYSDRVIYRVELTGLNPASYYEFRVGELANVYKFRTMPVNLNKPIRFAQGGDTDYERHTMSATAMKFDPDFIVWGGDYAYSDADPIWLYREYGWFEGIRNHLISDDGRVVPIILAIGNHEMFREISLIRGRGVHHEHTEEEAKAYMEKHNLWDRKVTWFFDLFAFPGNPAYQVLDFSDYLSIVLLDSGHHSSVEGEQTEWLEETLRERSERPHVFPVYHVPAFPTYRGFMDSHIKIIRDMWVPLFERFGVRVAFEHHDHQYKRTYPIRNGEIANDGVVYIGDGNWARSSRELVNVDAWYIKKNASVRHGIIVTLHGTHQHFLMVDEEGNIIDEYPQTPVKR